MWSNTHVYGAIHKPENNTIEIFNRETSNAQYAIIPSQPVPDRIYKEVYGVIDGIITLIKTIEAKHMPAHMVTEKIIFEE